MLEYCVFVSMDIGISVGGAVAAFLAFAVHVFTLLSLLHHQILASRAGIVSLPRRQGQAHDASEWRRFAHRHMVAPCGLDVAW